MLCFFVHWYSECETRTADLYHSITQIMKTREAVFSIITYLFQSPAAESFNIQKKKKKKNTFLTPLLPHHHNSVEVMPFSTKTRQC